MTAPAPPAPTAKAPDPRRTLLGLKGVALGVTALATAGVTGLVLVAQTDATAGQTAEEVVVEQSEEDKEIAELEAKLAAAKKKQAEDSDADAE